MSVPISESENMSPSTHQPYTPSLFVAQSGLVEALDRIQAIIKFDLHGHVLQANSLFLQAMGYEFHEMVGRHHRIFCDPDHAESEAYDRFWTRLRCGEAQAGEFHYLGKDGRTVWLQASYNPVRGVDGQIDHIVKFATDITPAKLAAAEYEGQMRALNKVQAVVEFDMQGRVLHANENFLAMFGYGLQEIVGRSHSLFCDPLDAHGAEYESLWERLRQGQFDSGEYRRLSKSGATIWIQCSYNPIIGPDDQPYKVVKFATDITADKNNDLLLLRTKQALELSTQAAQIGFWDYDIAGDTLHLSPFGATLLKTLPEVPLALESLLARVEQRDILEQAIQHATQGGGGWDLELLLQTFNGEQRWLRIIGHAEQIEGRCIRLNGTMQDIQVAKQREMELRHAQKVAEDAARTKDQFLATVSHELRTPLNAILGFGQMLEMDEHLTEENKDLVQDMVNAGKHLLALVNDLLDLAKVNHSQIPVTLVPVALNAVLDECEDLIEQAAQANGITLDIARESAHLIQVDRVWLKQVLINLMSNAVKYNRPDGRIEVRTQLVDERSVRILVSDTGIGIGIGIEEKYLGSLFKPFNRLGAKNSAIEGTGIGLNITKKMVRKMHGRIGVGSTFWVEFPLAHASEDRPGQEAEPGSPPRAVPSVDRPAARLDAPALRTPSQPILVAEDNPVNRKVIGQQLKRLGYACEFVGNGSVALSRWREQSYALLLTDLQMPYMGGYELAQHIRSEEGEGVRMPIIVLSANAMDASWDGWRAMGVDDFLTKPVKIDLLGEKLAHWMRVVDDGACLVAELASSVVESDQMPVEEDVLPSLSVLDLDVLAELIGGGHELVREFLQDYRTSAAELVPQLHAGFAEAEWRQVARVAHTLKSSSRSVGAMALGEVCERLEKAGTQGQADEIARQMPLLERQWNKLMQAMAAALAAASSVA